MTNGFTNAVSWERVSRAELEVWPELEAGWLFVNICFQTWKKKKNLNLSDLDHFEYPHRLTILLLLVVLYSSPL